MTPPFEYTLECLYPQPKGVRGGCVTTALKKIGKHPEWEIPDFVTWEDLVKTVIHTNGCVYKYHGERPAPRNVIVRATEIEIDSVVFAPPFLLGLYEPRSRTFHIEAIQHASELINYVTCGNHPAALEVVYLVKWWKDDAP